LYHYLVFPTDLFE
jgi:hypothetical protein